MTTGSYLMDIVKRVFLDEYGLITSDEEAVEKPSEIYLFVSVNDTQLFNAGIIDHIDDDITAMEVRKAFQAEDLPELLNEYLNSAKYTLSNENFGVKPYEYHNETYWELYFVIVPLQTYG